MNIPIDQSTSALSDFVFRAADRMRIDGCANAIAREGLSLALQCEHEALLDHYVSLLLARLRQQAPESSIEVYFPANTDSLLARFNEVLAQQSVKQAVKGPTGAVRAQIWLVHDAQSLPEAEVQLLARLIQNFPGANIRAILMMTGTPGKTPLSAFGRKILRWDIEAPTEEQTQAALETARNDGRLQAVSQLVRQIQRRSWSSAEQPPSPEALATPPQESVPETSPSAFKQRMAQFQAVGQQTTGHWKNSLRSLRWNAPKNWRVIAAMIVALLLSVMIMMWLQPQAFGIGPQTKTLPIAPVTPAVIQPPATATPEPRPLETTPKVSVPDTAATNPPLVGTAATPVPAPLPNPIPSKAEVTEPPDPAMQAQAWIRSLDPMGFLVQHGSTGTYEGAMALKNKFAGLKQAEIVAAYRPGEKLAHFVIVSGPYAQVTQGFEAAKRRDIPSNSWVRSTRTLQEQLKMP